MNNKKQLYIQDVANDARQEEIDEVWASSGLDIYTALEESVNDSIEWYPFLENDKAIGLFGIRPISLIDGMVSPWLITTNRARQNPRYIVKFSKPVVQYWSNKWPVLINFIDARYEESLRWAKWVGFEISKEPVLIGDLQLPFYMIQIRKD